MKNAPLPEFGAVVLWESWEERSPLKKEERSPRPTLKARLSTEWFISRWLEI
jgi:hypothetical protein